ncbi:MAG: fructokinase [Thermoanaerobacteraceae bacterium]|nr:fructokinase [Thermoanaerobacteraceae bacterium]
MGALLYGICKRGILLDEINIQELEDILDFASAAGGLCTTKRGGIPAMPTLEEVRLCVKNIKKL